MTKRCYPAVLQTATKYSRGGTWARSVRWSPRRRQGKRGNDVGRVGMATSSPASTRTRIVDLEPLLQTVYAMM